MKIGSWYPHPCENGSCNRSHVQIPHDKKNYFHPGWVYLRIKKANESSLEVQVFQPYTLEYKLRFNRFMGSCDNSKEAFEYLKNMPFANPRALPNFEEFQELANHGCAWYIETQEVPEIRECFDIQSPKVLQLLRKKDRVAGDLYNSILDEIREGRERS